MQAAPAVPLQNRDPRAGQFHGTCPKCTGRWVKARYKAEPTEIAARYAECGPGEERRPIGVYFNPGRREGE